MPEPLIETRRLSKWYGSHPAVRDVSFHIDASEVLGYLGPNGSGKSTTVAMLTGLLEPTAGAILFRGQPITSDLVEYRREVGYVPEEPHLYPFLSAREHLELLGSLRDMDERIAARRASALLEIFGLADHQHEAMSSYSKGMRQKVLLCGALLHDPVLVILDEPGSGLDATTLLIVRHLVSELAAAGKGVLYSSHELHTVEQTCSRVLLLHRGRVVAHDSIERLRTALAQPSLEAVVSELVLDVDPRQVARDTLSCMRLGRAS